MINIKNKVLSLFLSLTMVISMLPQMRLNVRADGENTFNVNGVTYEVIQGPLSGNEVKIKNTIGATVVIPAEVKDEGITYAVVSIVGVGADLEKLIFEKGSKLNGNLPTDLFGNTNKVRSNPNGRIDAVIHEENPGDLEAKILAATNVIVIFHEKNNWSTQPATCTEMEKTTCNADGCGGTVIERIPALGHSATYEVNAENPAQISVSCERDESHKATVTLTVTDEGQIHVDINDSVGLVKETTSELLGQIEYYKKDDNGAYTVNASPRSGDGKTYEARLTMGSGQNSATAKLEFYNGTVTNRFLMDVSIEVVDNETCSPILIISGIRTVYGRNKARCEYSKKGGNQWEELVKKGNNKYVGPKENGKYEVRCFVPAGFITEEEDEKSLVGRHYAEIISESKEFTVDENDHSDVSLKLPGTGETNILVHKCNSCSKEFGRITLNAPTNLIASESDEGRKAVFDIEGDVSGPPESFAVEYYRGRIDNVKPENKLNEAPKEAGTYTAVLGLKDGEEVKELDAYIEYTIVETNADIDDPSNSDAPSNPDESTVSGIIDTGKKDENETPSDTGKKDENKTPSDTVKKDESKTPSDTNKKSEDKKVEDTKDDKEKVKTVTKTTTNFKTGDANNVALLVALVSLSLALGLMVMRKRRLDK